MNKWLADNSVNVLEWAAQSPDINPIEYLWEVLERNVQKKISNKNEALQTAQEALQTAWESIPFNITKALVDSLPRRLLAIRQSRGNPTKY